MWITYCLVCVCACECFFLQHNLYKYTDQFLQLIKTLWKSAVSQTIIIILRELCAVTLLIAHNPFLLLVVGAGNNATPGANCDCYHRLTLPPSLLSFLPPFSVSDISSLSAKLCITMMDSVYMRPQQIKPHNHGCVFVCVYIYALIWKWKPQVLQLPASKAAKRNRNIRKFLLWQPQKVIYNTVEYQTTRCVPYLVLR